MNVDPMRTGEHPDLETLAALCDRRLPEPDRPGLVSHLADCRACREIVAGVTGLPEPGRSRRSLPWQWMGLAATVLLAAAIAYRVATPAQQLRQPAPIIVPASPEPENPPAAPAVPAPSVPEPAPAAPAPVEVLRGGARTIGGKTFHLEAGEWVDQAYDATSSLPVLEVSDPRERRRLLKERPALAPYASLGGRVTVVFEGTVYRFLAPSAVR
jgi:hypothetical protein